MRINFFVGQGDDGKWYSKAVMDDGDEYYSDPMDSADEARRHNRETMEKMRAAFAKRGISLQIGEVH